MHTNSTDHALDNPFLNRSPLDLPLDLETCQTILYRGMRTASAENIGHQGLFDNAEFDDLRHQISRFGWDAVHMHPRLVMGMFDRVTTNVVKYVGSLYCERIQRPICSVNEIMAGLARLAGVPPIDPRAIWALCVYFNGRRNRRTDATESRLDSPWILHATELPVRVTDRLNRTYSPKMVSVGDLSLGRVIAFRLTHPDELEQSVRSCLYDAIVAQRKPCVADAAGLEWKLPQRILVEPGLPFQSIQDAISELPDCSTESASLDREDNAALTSTLRGNWCESLEGQTIESSHLETLFDNYLYRKQGFDPRRSAHSRKLELGHLAGFNRDPADVLPALRKLLIPFSGYISPEGHVEFDGLSYTHTYLSMWPGRQVELRQSAEAEAHAWVYFGPHVICKASALQLRRLDGTYRAKRTEVQI